MQRVRLTVIAMALASCRFVSPVSAADIDEDGVDDGLEQTLIDMYRPMLHFDSDQYIRTCSVEWYIRHSELVWRKVVPGGFLDFVLLTNSQLDDPNDPDSPLRILLQGGGDIPPSTTTLEPGNVGYRINVFDDFHAGPPGPTIEAVGMYARVTPLAGPLIYTNGLTLPPINYQDFYLIQYWQFMPYNDFTAPLGSGDHEGDWMWIDVFVERACPHDIHFIVHHHHGDDHCSPSATIFGSIPQLPTRPFPLPCDPAHVAHVPQCYLEANVHEWWPFPSSGGECEFVEFDNPSHDGLLGGMETQNVINLGERFAPMPGLEPQLILLFNGLWGHDHGFPNGPSGGPLRQLAPGYPFSPLFVAHVDPAAPPWSDQGLGSRFHPFPSIDDALATPDGVQTGGRVLLTPSNYPGAYALSRPMRLEREGTGSVVIGR